MEADRCRRLAGPLAAPSGVDTQSRGSSSPSGAGSTPQSVPGSVCGTADDGSLRSTDSHLNTAIGLEGIGTLLASFAAWRVTVLLLCGRQARYDYDRYGAGVRMSGGHRTRRSSRASQALATLQSR